VAWLVGLAACLCTDCAALDNLRTREACSSVHMAGHLLLHLRISQFVSYATCFGESPTDVSEKAVCPHT
jgi:hypothetical protein